MKFQVNIQDKSYKILIVDDEIDNIKSINHFIFESKEPYILYQALNGDLAFKIAVAEIPDLIITDWEMPGMDGIELIKHLQLNESTAEIPIIMCTGVMTTSENLHTALMAGAVDYIRKPIDKIELMARIKSMLMLSDSRKVLKKEYEVIKQKNKFIQALIESIPHPMVYYKLNGEIKGCNRRFENLLGSGEGLLIGASIYRHWFYLNSALHRDNDQLLLQNRNEVAYESEGGTVSSDFIYSKSLYYDTAGEIEGIMCVLTDVSELKQAHNEIMENKKRELTSSALRLIQISELNNNLISDLETIHGYTNKKGSELIRQTITKFNLNSGENFWHEFESRFENVYESFYVTLNQLFPDLTPGEKKLCALLRLNLSSKDIAAITFQNPQSVDMARYRLRKKLNLKQEENLIDFLMNIN
jgi:PAS domain S-box-containing protein